eukprot:GHVS01041344.1.p1 GENE.GHVS01041344.1~~GHVS01041344.1.p1  ORF type:complete len:713 (-),score=151.43 GHVS01041344.1:392-2530(-)
MAFTSPTTTASWCCGVYHSSTTDIHTHNKNIYSRQQQQQHHSRCSYYNRSIRSLYKFLLPLLILLPNNNNSSPPSPLMSCISINLLSVSAQISILSPSGLKKQLCPPSAPLLPGATATFGSPSYGEVILGRMYFIDSPTNLCKQDVTMDAIFVTTPNHTRRLLHADTGGSGDTGGGDGLFVTEETKTEEQQQARFLDAKIPPLTLTTTIATKHATPTTSSSSNTTDSATVPPPQQQATVVATKTSNTTTPITPPQSSSSLYHPFPSSASRHAKTVRNIFVIRRGGCTFVTKARHAQTLKADAVVIVDDIYSSWKRTDIRHVVMADNGKGFDIEIPSMLITNADGEAIISAIQNAQVGGNVYAELEWSVPRSGVVDVDFWTDNTREDQGRRFLREFAGTAKALGPHLHFAIHFYLFQMPREIAGDFCLDPEGTLCAETPASSLETTSSASTDNHVVAPITGRDVVEEDMRQLCLFNTTLLDSPNIPGSNWSPSFWDYIVRWDDTCKFYSKKAETRYGTICSETVMRELGLDAVGNVKECMEGGNGLKLLQDERENKSWTVLTLRVNDIRFSGRLEASTVTKAICAGFETPPAVCESLLSDIEKKKIKALADEIMNNNNNNNNDSSSLSSPSSLSSVSHSSFWVMFFFIFVIVGISFYLYHKFLNESVRDSMRQEVMMEVRTQIQEYQQLPENDAGAELSSSALGYKQTRPLIF